MARQLLLVLLLLLLLPSIAWSQAVSATLLGTVTDASGAVVPNAAVTATDIATGVPRRATTNQEGIYTIPYLPPGTYRVEIEAAGFKKFLRDNIELRATMSTRVDTSLEPGQVTEVVEVRAELPLLQTDRSEVSRSFAQKQVTELPLANRSFQSLVGLMPGVSPPSVDFTAAEDPQGTTFFRANGQGNSANNTQVDGVDNTNPTLGLSIYLPSAEVVQEVNITTSNYNAEFGRAGGAVINAITRGGTNDLHGSLFEFHRNTRFRARNMFNAAPQPKPAFIRNEFGGTLGGPIVKNRTFFFGGYQGRILRQSNTMTTSVPAAAWLTGDFSDVPQLNLYDPATGNPDGTGRQRFANNQIPMSRFHPVARNLQDRLPFQNQAGFTNNLIVNTPFRYDGHSYDGRVDHTFSDRTRGFAKVNFSDYEVISEAALGNEIGEGTISTPYTVTAILNATHNFSPTLLAEFRAGFNRYFTEVNGINVDGLSNQDLGIRNPNPDPISSRGMARIQISGMQGIGTPVFYPLINADNLFNFINTWNKQTGRHALKWGIDLHRNRMDRFQPQGLNFGPRGRFDFNPGTTALRGGPPLGAFGTFANSFAAFLIGAPDQTSRTFMPITPTNRQWQFFTFFHDTLQVTPWLTLDLGVRWELYTPIEPRYAGGASNYDPATNSLLIAGFGDNSLANNVKTDWNNFAPRIGFSYRMTSSSVVRGGYGISYYTGRFGFTGGTLSTQFPVIYNIQEGVNDDFAVDGAFDTLPVVPDIPIPANGVISPAPNQAFFVVPRDNPMPLVHSFNLTYQRELGWNMAWDIGYVGSLGRRLPYQRQLNAALPGAGAAGRPFNVQFGRTANVDLRANGLNNNYNSLQTNLTKRFSSGLSFTAAYTWSKVLGVGDDQGGFVVHSDVRRNYGPASYDRTHMFTASHIYEVPFGPGKPYLQSGWGRYVLGGWQLNGILRIVSGSPFTPTADATPCNCPGNGNFADVVAPLQYTEGTGRGLLWFDPGSFAPPGTNRFGNAGRHSIRGPGFMNYDLSLFRNFAIMERARLEFRAEAYNLTNTPRWGNPVNSVNNPDFGQILSAAGERELQLALRLTF
ncbi:MAG: carboxypeptidase regulatory-like domain-containing protein [Bryobacteraceae bacterium]